jgi:hypothetical protein
VVTLVVQDGQSKIKVEEPGVDQFEAEHFPTSQRGELTMSRQRCPEAIASQDSSRQHGEIALCLVDRNGRLHASAVQGAVALMPRRVDRDFPAALWIGESGRQRVAIDHGGAVRGIDHVGQVR